MARKPTPPRLIPTFALPKPWTEPMTQEEQEATASSALLSGAAPTDRGVTALMQIFAGDSAAYAQALGHA